MFLICMSCTALQISVLLDVCVAGELDIYKPEAPAIYCLYLAFNTTTRWESSYLSFIENLLFFRSNAKHFLYVISFNLHNKPNLALGLFV